ncbi:hypothetical protein VTK26DRAFT_5177 [Humicola hyalothermophila]
MNTAGAVVLAIVLVLLAAGVGWVIFTRTRAKRLGLPPPSWTSYIPFLGSSSSSSPYPSPAPGGLIGWVNDRIRLFRLRRNRNTRTAAGAYEGNSPYRSGYAGNANSRGGFGRLGDGDGDDDPWDARVGHLGHNPYDVEERELGPASSHEYGSPYGQGGSGASPYAPPEGEGYQMNLPIGPDGQQQQQQQQQQQEEEEEGGEETRGRTRSRSPGPPGPPSGLRHQQQSGAAKGNNPFEDGAEPSNISLRGVSPRPMDTSFAARKAAAEAAAAGGKREHADRRSVFREGS